VDPVRTKNTKKWFEMEGLGEKKKGLKRDETR